MDTLQLYKIFQDHPKAQTDTRKLSAGDIFFALSGPNFNGNTFASEALDTGAAYVVVDERPQFDDERVILVDNVLASLQDLAKHHRQQFDIPVIAITGSNGKTTTKELLSAVLSTAYKTYTTEGNLNNHIGIPLTLLKIRSDAEMAVVEMGANHRHEIEDYCKYVLPTHGIITNCGKAHLEGFGGEEGVKKGKGELYDFLRTNKGTAIIYKHYDYLQQMSAGIGHVFTYGTEGADVTGNIVSNEPFLTISTGVEGALAINTRLAGEYNLPNVLCAVATGTFFGVPGSNIKAAIEAYLPTNSRSQLIKLHSNTIILDAYNANPDSMKAAIENFAKVRSNKKVLMLGAMMELGAASVAEHAEVVRLLEKLNPGEVVLVGGDFKSVSHAYNYFESAALARDWFTAQAFEDTHLLIKGSRSIRMETILT